MFDEKNYPQPRFVSFRHALSYCTPQGLLTLVTCSKTSVVVAEAVIVLRQLLQQNPNFEGSGDVVRRLAVLLLQSFLDSSFEEEKGGGRAGENDQGGGNALAVASAARASLAQPGARASIIWTLGEYHQHISGVAPDVLRVLAKAFPELEEEVKMQVRGVGRLCSFYRRRLSFSASDYGAYLLHIGSIMNTLFFDNMSLQELIRHLDCITLDRLESETRPTNERTLHFLVYTHAPGP